MSAAGAGRTSDPTSWPPAELAAATAAEKQLDTARRLAYNEGMTETPTTARNTYYLSSTGMLHEGTCMAPFFNRCAIVAGAAEKITRRCLKCRPTPNGTEVDQAARTRLAHEQQEVDNAARAAEIAAEAAAWAAQHTDELDAAILAFYADENADTYRAMIDLALDDYSYPRRARELGVTL